MLNELKKHVLFLHHLCNEVAYKKSVLRYRKHEWNLNEYKLIANALSKNAGDFFFPAVFANS